MNILFAGGGTGGHVYPAIALAEEFVKRKCVVHFIGTKTHVEAKIVPENGFDISFIWISGFQRSLSLRNLRKLDLNHLMINHPAHSKYF